MLYEVITVSSGGESEKTPPPTSSNVNFSEWNDTNPCFHCGKCCSNVTLELSLIGKTSDAFGELLPYVKNPDDPYESLHEVPEEPGIYFVIGKRGYYLCRITSYNVCYTKLLRLKCELDGFNFTVWL